jgi:hypothetical protein
MGQNKIQFVWDVPFLTYFKSELTFESVNFVVLLIFEDLYFYKTNKK